MSERTALSEESSERGWKERLEDLREAAGALLGTRTAIFREELALKIRHFVKAAIGLGLAWAFLLLALFVFTAFLAALLSRFFGSVLIGILAVFVLYAAAAATAGVIGWRALSRVRIHDFPLTRVELRKDWEAVETSWKKKEEEDEESAQEETNLEARFRTGSE